MSIFRELFDEKLPTVRDPWPTEAADGKKVRAQMMFDVLPSNHPLLLRGRTPAEIEEQEYFRGLISEYIDEKLKAADSKGYAQMLGEIDLEELERYVNVEDLKRRFTKGNEAEPVERTALRLAGWQGVNDENGNPIEFSQEAAVELLSNETLIPEVWPLASFITVGAALQSLIVAESVAATTRRQLLEAQAAKKSAGPAASSSGGGAARARSGGKSKRASSKRKTPATRAKKS